MTQFLEHIFIIHHFKSSYIFSSVFQNCEGRSLETLVLRFHMRDSPRDKSSSCHFRRHKKYFLREEVQNLLLQLRHNPTPSCPTDFQCDLVVPFDHNDQATQNRNQEERLFPQQGFDMHPVVDFVPTRSGFFCAAAAPFYQKAFFQFMDMTMNGEELMNFLMKSFVLSWLRRKIGRELGLKNLVWRQL